MNATQYNNQRKEALIRQLEWEKENDDRKENNKI